MSLTLTKPAPRQGSAQEDFQAVLAEWLLGWFDGTPKPYSAGDTTLSWPALPPGNIAFGQFALPPGMDGIHFGIQVLGQGDSRLEVAGLTADTRRYSVETRALVMIYVRASIRPGNTTFKTSGDALVTFTGRLQGLLESVTALEALNAKHIYTEQVRVSDLPGTEGCLTSLISFTARYRSLNS